MTKYVYLVVILSGLAGMLFGSYRLGLGVWGPRLVRTVLVTVPLFLLFDLVGAGRGWFRSSPAYNSVIFSVGIPLEEPLLLTLLTLLSVVLWRLGQSAS